MNKIDFTNRWFFLGLAFFVLIMIAYRGFLTIVTGSILGILELVTAFVLYFFIATRHKYTKKVLRFWVNIFLISIPLAKLIFNLLSHWGSNFSDFSPDKMATGVGFIILGCGILLGSNKFIVKAEHV